MKWKVLIMLAMKSESNIFFYIIIYVLKIVLPKPDGPLWWRWSSFPVALSWTPAKAAESWIQG